MFLLNFRLVQMKAGEIPTILVEEKKWRDWQGAASLDIVIPEVQKYKVLFFFSQKF